MYSRLPLPEASEFDPGQRAIYEEILRSRGGIDGPLLAWLHSPELALRAEKLGRFCRWGTLLSARESELVILTVAAHHACGLQQQLHEPLARRAGLSEAAVAAIRSRQPPLLQEPRLAVLHAVTCQMLETHRIEQALFDEARRLLGKQGLVEAIGVLSFYAFTAMTCNAFELALRAPEGTPP